MKKISKLILLSIVAAILIAVSVYLLGFYIPQMRENAERERLVREYYQSKYELYEQENDKFEDYEVDVAFLGDSLTDGYDLARYYPQYVVANRGIGGETSHGLLERIELSVVELVPKVAVILIGGNNLYDMFDSYEDILSVISEKLPNTQVILCSLTSMGGSWAHKNPIAAYNNVIIEQLAEKYGFFFVDLYSPLLDLTTGEIRSSYTTDGAHLTHEGYFVFTEALTPVIEEALEKFEDE